MLSGLEAVCCAVGALALVVLLGALVIGVCVERCRGWGRGRGDEHDRGLPGGRRGL